MGLAKVDKVYATNEKTVEHLHSAAKHFLSVTDDLNALTSVGEPCAGANAFNVVTNVVEGRMVLPNGFRRKFRLWIPEDGVEPKGTIITLHGYGEHSGRYHKTAHSFTEAGFRVIGYDHKFHGEDENANGGKITKIKTFYELVDDACSLVSLVESKYSDQPYFVLGHSMGGLITLLTTLQLQETWKCQGVVFSCPAIRIYGNDLAPDPYNWFFKGVTKGLSAVAPGLLTPAAPLEVLSHDPVVIEDAKNDSLSFGDKISTKFAKHFGLEGSADAQKQLQQVTSPFLICIGTEDAVVDADYSRKLFEVAASQDKTKKEYEGGFHEILNEYEEMRNQVLSDMTSWINERS